MARYVILVFLFAASFFCDAAEVFYLHTDIHGNVVAETDENGAVVRRYEYEPYGLPIGEIPDGPGFTGHDMDGESGLIYMQQRYYDPSIGVFLSIDPMAVDTATAWNFNRYNYAANNPYKYIDKDGRAICVVFPPTPVCAAGAVKVAEAALIIGAAIGIIDTTQQFADALPQRNEAGDDAVGTQPGDENWFGENARETPGRVNTDRDSNVDEDWAEITGGDERVDPETSDRIGPNNERLRETDNGPRIDLPKEATGNKKHETVHYPPRDPKERVR